MWFNILKKPQLSMGDVGLVDLSNVPEEEGRCKPKFLRMFNRLVDFFDITAMDKKDIHFQSTFKVGSSIVGWNFKRKEKYTYPLKEVWLGYNDKLPDINYCEMLERAKRNNWGKKTKDERPFTFRLRWAENADKEYKLQIQEQLERLLKME